jgi:hypothetical protein
MYTGSGAGRQEATPAEWKEATPAALENGCRVLLQPEAVGGGMVSSRDLPDQHREGRAMRLIRQPVRQRLAYGGWDSHRKVS